MGICSKCGKKLGFFTREYKCIYCGKIFCKDCIKKIYPSDNIRYLWSLLDLPNLYCVCHGSHIFSTDQNVTCHSCYPKYLQQAEPVKEALLSTEEVELLPSTYFGKRNVIGERIEISSNWHTDWNDCDDDLIMQAHYYKCNCVMKIKKERREEEEEREKSNGKGTYTVTRVYWRKTGLACKVLKK